MSFRWLTFKNRRLHRHAEPTCLKALNGCNAGFRCSCRGTPSVPPNIQNKGFSPVPAPMHGSRSLLFLNWFIQLECTSAAFVSTAKFQSINKIDCKKRKAARPEGVKVLQSLQPRLCLLQPVYEVTSALYRSENRPCFEEFSAEMEVAGGVTSEGS